MAQQDILPTDTLPQGRTKINANSAEVQAALAAREKEPYESAVILGAAGTDAATGTIVTHRTRRAYTLTRLSASVSVAPTGAAMQIACRMNGTLLGTITIAAGDKDSLPESTATVPLTQIPSNAEWEYEIIQIGSTDAGQEPVVYQEGYRSIDAFVMTIDTSLGDGLASMTIPAGDLGTYDAEIDWGDGTTSHITAYNDANLSHTYSTGGRYAISITGTFPHIYFNDGGDKDKVVSIDAWGDVGWMSLERSFYGCSNLSSVAPGVIRGDASLTSCNNAWRDNSLTSWTVELPASLTSCRDAWHGNSLTSWTVKLPANLTSCAYAWFGNSLTSWTVELPAGLTDCAHAWRDNSLTSWTVDLPASLTDCAAAWFDNSLTSWTGGGSWAGVTDAANCANVANINETDYNALLVLIEATNQNNGVSYNFGTSKHSGAGTTARNALVNDHSADITDGGPV